MEITQVFVLIGIAVIFSVGIIGIVVPVIPSLPIVWAGIVVYGLVYGFDPAFNTLLLWTGVIAVVGTILDTLVGMVGARVYGASGLGMVGALVGGVIGFIILNLPGLLLGSFAGTLLCEYLVTHDRDRSLRAAWGTMIGFVGGTILKLILCIIMIVMFVRFVF